LCLGSARTAGGIEGTLGWFFDRMSELFNDLFPFFICDLLLGKARSAEIDFSLARASNQPPMQPH